jgi:hypothetical protein
LVRTPGRGVTHYQVALPSVGTGKTLAKIFKQNKTLSLTINTFQTQNIVPEDLRLKIQPQSTTDVWLQDMLTAKTAIRVTFGANGRVNSQFDAPRYRGVFRVKDELFLFLNDKFLLPDLPYFPIFWPPKESTFDGLTKETNLIIYIPDRTFVADLQDSTIKDYEAFFYAGDKTYFSTPKERRQMRNMQRRKGPAHENIPVLNPQDTTPKMTGACGTGDLFFCSTHRIYEALPKPIP